ncbi:MAG: phosphate butyryltransferase [Dethiobacter sp.]|jgi:phosphotransacetylase|nr:phosphate butyryltransferase [Dethiobacter sp.]
MKTFDEILKSAPAKHILVAPAPHGSVSPAAVGGGHSLTLLPGGGAAVKEACRMVREKEADILMQGDMPLGEFFALLAEAGVKRDALSFVTVLENKKQNKLLLLTDTYIHNFPTLEQKIKILERAIAFARLLGIETPKVAALSAIETVNAAIVSTVDAAVLSKMSQRRQFQAMVEGPLDIDAVLAREAAVKKGIESTVCGDADIILCPDIETATVLSQAFTFIGAYPAAGVLLGAFPLVINPRLIPPDFKEVELALAALRAGDFQ